MMKKNKKYTNYTPYVESWNHEEDDIISSLIDDSMFVNNNSPIKNYSNIHVTYNIVNKSLPLQTSSSNSNIYFIVNDMKRIYINDHSFFTHEIV